MCTVYVGNDWNLYFCNGGSVLFSALSDSPTRSPTTAPTLAPTLIPTPVPTRTPSAIPTSPTASPSVVPTAVPTIPTGAVDCRSLCNVYTSLVTNLAPNNLLGSIVMPTYFTLTFDVLTTFDAPAGSHQNIMDIVDSVTETSFLSVASTDTGNMRLMYREIAVFEEGAVGSPGTWTTVTVTVQPSAIRISASGDNAAYIMSPPPAILDTTGHVYKLYFSNAYEAPATGQFKTISIKGKIHSVCCRF